MHQVIQNKKNHIIFGFPCVGIMNSLVHENLLMGRYFFLGGTLMLAVRFVLITICLFAVYIVYFWKRKFLEDFLEQNYQNLKLSQTEGEVLKTVKLRTHSDVDSLTTIKVNC